MSCFGQDLISNGLVIGLGDDLFTTNRSITQYVEHHEKRIELMNRIATLKRRRPNKNGSRLTAAFPNFMSHDVRIAEAGVAAYDLSSMDSPPKRSAGPQ